MHSPSSGRIWVCALSYRHGALEILRTVGIVVTARRHGVYLTLVHVVARISGLPVQRAAGVSVIGLTNPSLCPA